MLILPLSIPTFINAIAYVGITDYTGLFRQSLRAINTDWNIDIMNEYGVIFILSTVLYPYVYIAARTAFMMKSSSFIEAARTLGMTLPKIFIKISIPLASSFIFSGLILVIMEVLNDYGVVSYFGVPTYTFGIFRSWLALGDLPNAVALSFPVLLFVVFIFLLENYYKGKRRFSSTQNTKKLASIAPQNPKLVAFICWVPVVFGFIIPVLQIIWWAYLSFYRTDWKGLFQLIGNTAFIGVITSICVCLFAILMSYGFRIIKPNKKLMFLKQLPMLGYAMPGAIIAVGIIALIILINPKMIYMGGYALIFGYIIRFFAVGYGTIDAGFEKVPDSFDDVGAVFGKNSLFRLSKIHLPLVKAALVSGLIMVFVDVTKELSLTLILRPFNFETLSTRAFQYAKDEMAPRSAIPSLLIILTSIFPIYYLNKLSRKEK